MALVTLNFFSESLGMQSEVYVAIPQQSTGGEIGIENNCSFLIYSNDFSLITK